MQKKKIALTGLDGEIGSQLSDLLHRAIPNLDLVLLSSGRDCLERMRKQGFDCILLSDQLPDANGLTVLRQIRLTQGHRHTPVVILAEKDDSRKAVQSIKLGANDYLAIQHADVTTLRQTILSALSSSEQLRAQEQAQQSLQRQAFTDPLTGLQNRRGFERRVQALNESQSAYGPAYALIMIDLDKFKRVNDSFGHDAGDCVLIEMAERLRQATRSQDEVFRIGGDEFVIVIDDVPPQSSATGLAQRLSEIMQVPVLRAEQVLYPGGCSMGVAYYPKDGVTPDELKAVADQAMYAAKSRGGGVVFSSDITAGRPLDQKRR